MIGSVTVEVFIGVGVVDVGDVQPIRLKVTKNVIETKPHLLWLMFIQRLLFKCHYNDTKGYIYQLSICLQHRQVQLIVIISYSGKF